MSTKKKNTGSTRGQDKISSSVLSDTTVTEATEVGLIAQDDSLLLKKVFMLIDYSNLFKAEHDVTHKLY